MSPGRSRSVGARRLLRPAFLVAVLIFVSVSLHGHTGDIGEALRRISPVGVVVGLVLVLLGLAATGVLWQRLMATVGARLSVRDGMALYFLAQLGKYIPGSVWPIAAQAHLARRAAVPPRATVAVGLIALGYQVATAIVVGTLAILLGALSAPWPTWLSVAALLVAAAGPSPIVVRRLGSAIAGQELTINGGDTLVAVGLMAMTWTAFSMSLVLVSPSQTWTHLLAYGGAFTLAYTVGVLVVLAPAGLGVRETLFVVLLVPVTGLSDALTLALVARVVHLTADLLMSAGWTSLTRRQPAAGSA